MVCDPHRRVLVEEPDVETQLFDWGRLSWLSEPRVTGPSASARELYPWSPARPTTGTTTAQGPGR